MANVIKPKRSSTAGKVPTTSDLVSGEVGVNMTDQKVYINNGSSIVQVGAGKLTGLGDVSVTSPTTNQVLSWNGTSWVNATAGAGAGTVTSVDVSGGTTGLTTSGGPVTSSGTITLAGTLNVANGGTGATTAANALTNLGGIGTITSTDGSVTVSGTGTSRDLSVAVSASTTNVVVNVRNATGATLTKGTAVYISGATGQIPTVSKAQANAESTSAQTLGLINADLANNSNGYVTIIGLITNIDTSAYTDGAQLYLSGTTAGALTATKPSAPTHLVYVAVVEYAHVTQGKLFVKVQNGYELNEIHDVQISSPVSGNTLIYDASTSLWKNASLTAGTGINITNGAASITIANSGVTSVTATSPVASSGGQTPAISLNSAYGDTLNPYGSKTANYFLAAPNGAAGTPSFRAIVAADIPTLNQNTTGTASNVTGTVAIANGGTGATTQQAAINALAGAQTSGQYLRGNGTNVTMSAIQAGDVPTLNQNTTGTASNVTGTVAVANGGTGATTAANARTNLGLVIGTDVPSPTGSGASGTWNISITGNAGTATSVDFNNLTNKTGGTGTYTTSGDYRAPIFYDSNNTAYYVDPASTSNLNTLNSFSMTGGALITFNNSGTSRAGLYGTMGDNDQWYITGYATASNQGVLDIGTGDDAQSGTAAEVIMFSQYGPGTPWSGTLNNRAFIFTENGHTTFPGNFGIGLNKTAAPYSTTAPSAKLHVVNSTPTSIGSLPTGVTGIMDSNTNNYLLFRNTADNGTYSGIAFQDNNVGGYVVFGNAGGGGDLLYVAGYGGGQLQYGTADSISPSARTTVASWNSTGLQINNGDMRAPIYYDSDNTSYYGDFASVSNFSALMAGNKRFLFELGNNTINSMNPLWSWMKQPGAKLYPDEQFNDGTNGISVYNNAGGSAVTITRKNSSFADGSSQPPNGSGYVLEIMHAPGTSSGISPGFGGWYFATQTGAGKRFVCVFKMKVPSGRTVEFASNSTGTNSATGWLTNNSGTGLYEDYAFYVDSGTASWSSTFFFFINGGASTTFYTYLASATVYEVTNVGLEQARQYAASARMDAPIYYDSNDTSYYADPNSTSIFNVLGANRLYSGYDSGNTNSVSCSNWFRSSGDSGWYNASYGGGIYMVDGTWVRVYNNKQFYSQNYIQSDSSIRGPIFYDSNDTGYYADPASTSKFYNLQIANTITDPSTNGRIILYGNFHIDAFNGYDIYANYYSGRRFRTYYTSNQESFRTDTDGIVYAFNQFRTPIVYDNNNTSYYVDPASGSSLNYIISTNHGWTGTLSLRTVSSPSDWANMPMQYSQMFLAGQTATGTPSSNYGFFIKIANRDGGDGSGPGWGGFWMNYSGSGAWYGNTTVGSTYATWYRLTTYGENVASSLYATILYDSNDTGYYCDPNSVSVFNDIRINSGSTQIVANNTGQNTKWRALAGNTDVGISFYDANNRWAAQFYANYGEAYGFLNGNWASWDLRKIPNGNLYMNNNNSYYLNAPSDNYLYRVYGAADIRSPIFYDNNDTTYYVDPASFTNLYGGLYMAGPHGSTQIRLFLPAGNNGAATGQVTLQAWCSEPGQTWDWAGFGYNVTNDNGINGFGRLNTNFGQAYMRMGPSGQWYFYTTNTSGTRYTHIYLSPGNGVQTYGTFQNDSSVQAPIFYDSNNTGYYLNGDSTSNLYAVVSYSYQGNGNVGGTGSASWHPSGIYSAGYNWLYGGINAGGASVTNMGDARANIFYDYNDTSYYCNPNSDSQFNAVYANNWFRAQNDVGLYFQSYGYGLYAPQSGGNNYGNVMTYAVGRNGWTGYGLGSRITLMTDTNASGVTTGLHDSNVGWYWRYIYDSYFIVDRGYSQFANSARAPIFYDSDDTGYYLDPNSTSNSALRIRGGALHGPNPSWGAYLYVGTNGNPDVNTASVVATNGNLHLDAANGYVMYLNNYASSSYTVSCQSIRSPIFYDYNNTGYYVDPSWNSYIYQLESANRIFCYGDIRTNIYYDQNDTSYYIDPAGGTSANFAGDINFRGELNWVNSGTHYFDINGDFLIRYSDNSSFWYDKFRIWMSSNYIQDYTYGIRNAGDNTALIWGNDGNIGFMKKSGYPGCIVTRSDVSIYFAKVNQSSGAINVTGISGYTQTNIAEITPAGAMILAGSLTQNGSPSDERLKENIQPITGALSRVMQLDGVTFDWKEGTKQRDFVGLKEDMGFIAQQVQKSEPTLVKADEDGTLALRDRGIIALLVESIKEQQAMIESLRAELTALKGH